MNVAKPTFGNQRQTGETVFREEILGATKNDDGTEGDTIRRLQKTKRGLVMLTFLFFPYKPGYSVDVGPTRV